MMDDKSFKAAFSGLLDTMAESPTSLIALAAAAPEIPNWFKATVPARPAKPDEKPLMGLYPKMRQTLQDWLRDPIFDLVETAGEDKTMRARFADFDKQWSEYHTAVTQWEEVCDRERMAQWPIQYARMVLAEANRQAWAQ